MSGKEEIILILLLFSSILTGCLARNNQATTFQAATLSPTAASSDFACPVTEAVWAVHPEDNAIMGTPAFGYYIINQDQSIWASAWWWESEEFPLRASTQGNKVGWFRPAGETLMVTGRRLDGHSPPLETHIPCCYPTRFQSSGLYFPGEGCWEITATAGESVLTFIVRVEP